MHVRYVDIFYQQNFFDQNFRSNIKAVEFTGTMAPQGAGKGEKSSSKEINKAWQK